MEFPESVSVLKDGKRILCTLQLLAVRGGKQVLYIAEDGSVVKKEPLHRYKERINRRKGQTGYMIKAGESPALRARKPNALMEYIDLLDSDKAGLLDNGTKLLNLEHCRLSLNRGAGASRPKRSYTSPQGEIYFKFNMSNNEICAELFSYDLARQLDIDVAVTRLAKDGSGLGIASYDNGGYTEPSDDISYSVKDFIKIEGFVTMCLFDYLIMNEDRHAGNWGMVDGRVAPLFDHNYAFGGDNAIDDIDGFAMHTVTSPFYVTNENRQSHDTLLLYFVKYHGDEVSRFMRKLCGVANVSNDLWAKHYPIECKRLNDILKKRIQYMREKVREYNARQIDDNEF